MYDMFCVIFYFRPEYRDLILDLRHSQVRLLSFFSIFIKDNQDSIKSQNSTLSSRVIRLLNCSMASDVSSLRTELLSGFESVILTNFKSGKFSLFIIIYLTI